MSARHIVSGRENLSLSTGLYSMRPTHGPVEVLATVTPILQDRMPPARWFASFYAIERLRNGGPWLQSEHYRLAPVGSVK